MAQGSFKKGAGAPKAKGKAGRGNVAAKSKRLVNKGKTAVKKGCEYSTPFIHSTIQLSLLGGSTTVRVNFVEGESWAFKAHTRRPYRVHFLIHDSFKVVNLEIRGIERRSLSVSRLKFDEECR